MTEEEEKDIQEFEEYIKLEYPDGILTDNPMGKMVKDYMMRAWLASRRVMREKDGKDDTA